MPTYSINIKVAQSGAREAAADIGGIGPAAATASSALDTLQGYLEGLVGVSTLSSLGELLDSYQNLQNRIELVSHSEAEASLETKKLMDVANETRSTFQATADSYTRLALATEDMNISHEQVLTVVKELNQALILSGSSVETATYAIRQLATGLASGRLRGLQLISVLRTIPAAGILIAHGLGVTTAAFRELAQEGKVSSEDILNALLKTAPEMDKQFGKTIPTIQQSINELKNKFLEFFEALNTKYNILGNVTDALDKIGTHMNVLATVVISGALLGGLLAVIEAFTLLAAFTSPLILLATVIISAGVAMQAFGDTTFITKDNMVSLKDFSNALFENYRQHFGVLSEAWKSFSDSLTKVNWSGLAKDALWAVGQIRGIFGGLEAATFVIWDNLGKSLKLAFETAMLGVLEVVSKAVNGMISAYNFLASKIHLPTISNFSLSIAFDLSKDSQRLGADIGKAFSQGYVDGVADIPNAIGEAIDKARAQADLRLVHDSAAAQLRAAAGGAGAIGGGSALSAAQDQLSQLGGQNTGLISAHQLDFDAVIDKLKEEQKVLQDTSMTQKSLNELLKIEDELRTKGVTLTAAEHQKLVDTLQETEALKAKNDILKQTVETYQELTLKIQALNELIQAGGPYVNRYKEDIYTLEAQKAKLSNTPLGGLQAGVDEEAAKGADNIRLTEKLVTDAYSAMGKAQDEFIQKGKVNWRELGTEIVSDLLKIAEQALLTQAATALIGAGGGGGSSTGGIAASAGKLVLSLAGALATGGPAEGGRSYLVGEHGPEIFTPGNSGVVTPNGMSAGSPDVHVHVVNVRDPRELSNYLSSAEAGNIIVAQSTKNKTAMRTGLAIG